MNDGFKEFNCKLEELLFNVDNYFGSDKVLLLSEDDNEVNIYIVRRLFIKTKELPLVQVHDNVFKSNTK
jgi:DNA-directed RNA polymerase subunit H (RpoH/RPB5)